jgi:hypothetical protein
MENDGSMVYLVRRGEEQGTELLPHRHEDGMYVASLTRFERDYIRVGTLRELAILVRQGFSIRMSNPDSTKHKAPSLIAPASLGIAAGAQEV